MTSRAFCIVVQRMVGIVLLVWLGVEAIGACPMALSALRNGSWSYFGQPQVYFSPLREWWPVPTPAHLVQAIVLAWGAYLTFRGRRLAAFLCRGLGRGCQKCGYDTTGITSGKCPECGSVIDTSG